MPEILIEKGQIIKSKRGTVLTCYFVMPVHIGADSTIVRYEYSFWTKDKKAKTIKSHVLAEMLNNSYQIINP